MAGLIVDVVLAIIALFFIYKGAKKGFSGEIIGLVGLFVSVFCSWKFVEPAVDVAMRYVSPEFDRNIMALICAVAIFFTVEIIFAVVGAVLSYLVKVTQLSLTDHFFGLLIGVLKSCCIIILVYGVIASFSPIIPTAWMEESYTMKGASYVWPYVRDVLQSSGVLDFSHLTGGGR